MRAVVGTITLTIVVLAPMVGWGDEPDRYAMPYCGLLCKPPCRPWPVYNGCCPDDYCPKALTLDPCQKWCEPNDYDRKALPPCPPRSPLGCNDYDCKKCKILIGVPCTPFDSCGPPDGCCKDRWRPWHFWLP